MTDLKPEYHDREILERVATVEAEQCPFKYETAGIGYEDIIDRFSYEDFGNPPMIMLPNHLKYLSENGYLRQVYQKPVVSEYRLPPN